MRIIKVEIENINSVRGKWSIDFTDESYARNNNQFVISGETGSGKTTILDAITLGLYGCTPRIKVTKAENEVFSKGAGCCSAAVTYELNGELIRSEFSQTKARNNPSGNLQAPAYLIKNLTTDVELYNGGAVSDFRNRTAEITGLTYEQFGKSVLLAQGSFNQFLMANENEKASVLAKLNGTEGYKKAANVLWEKASEKIDECERKIERIDSIMTLSDEELAEHENKRSEFEAEIVQINSAISELTKTLNWKKEYDESEKALKKAADNKKNIDDEIEAFGEKNKELKQAETASKCEVQYSRYMDGIKKQRENEESIEQERVKLSKLEDDTQKSKEKYDTAKAGYDTVKGEKASKADLWKKVRALDIELQELKKQKDAQQRRAEDAKNDYNSKKSRVSDINQQIEQDEAIIRELDAYIDEHKQDAGLERIISGLTERDNYLKQNIDNANGLEKTKAEKELALTDLSNKCQSVNNVIIMLEEELKEYVSSNYKSISAVLRNNCISDGQACPVCGSLNHPFCKDNLSHEEKRTSDNQVAAKASELSEELEAKTAEKVELEQQKSGLESDIQNLKANINSLYTTIEKTISEINEDVSKWGYKVETNDFSEVSACITEIVDQLIAVQEKYKNTLIQKEEKAQNVKSCKASLDAIDLGAYSNRLKAEEDAAQQHNSNYQRKADERKELYDDNNVDDEELQYDEKLKRLAEDRKNSEEEYTKAQKETENIKSKLDLLVGQKDKLVKEVEDTTKCLQEVMETYCFGSVEELKKSFRSQTIIEDLRKTRDDLNNRKVECKSILEREERNYKRLSEKKLTDDTADEIESAISNCNEKKDEINKNIGQIKQILDENNEKVLQKRQNISRRETLVNEKLYYENVKSIIGAKDGKDVDIFVQKMVLGNLLTSANSYLEQMLPDYSLVQKPDSLVILLHDVNNEANDRPISNLSGGESFAISLSLALGIAEVASNSIHIETLFLDEGFGTLSGAPLEEAINCLRRLGNTGKTLGIITHVQRVIDSFDQKISARKVNGTSTLCGPGVEHNGVPTMN